MKLSVRFCFFLGLASGPFVATQTAGTTLKRMSIEEMSHAATVVVRAQCTTAAPAWDEGEIWSRHNRMQAQEQADAEGTFVLEDLAFVKQGRHSVGVQRQFSGGLGRKVNCQLAIALYHVGSAGFCPLWLQLYMPRSWLRSG